MTLKINITTINGLNQSPNIFKEITNNLLVNKILHLNSQDCQNVQSDFPLNQQLKKCTKQLLPEEILDLWKKNLLEQSKRYSDNLNHNQDRNVLFLYSYGYPIYQLIKKDLNIHFDKIVCFAPMIELTFTAKRLLYFLSLFPNFLNQIKIKSLNESKQRMKSYCTIAEYKAAFLAYRSLSNLSNLSTLSNVSQKINDNKILIIIDPKDELISAKKISDLFNQKNIIFVDSGKFHHQLFNEGTLLFFKKNNIINKIDNFLRC